MVQVVRSFDELSVGMTASTTRTFSRDDILTFQALAPDVAPVHSDISHAQAMGYSDILVFGWLAGAPFSGLLGMDLPGPATVLHWAKINMVAPVYPDEEILYQAKIRQLSATMKIVVLDLEAAKTKDGQAVIRGQAQCGFRI